MLVEEPPLERSGIVGGDLGGPHLRGGRCATGRQAIVERGGKLPAALQVELAVGIDRGRHRQECGRIARSLPAVPLGKARLGAVAPRDHERLDPRLVLRPRPEKPGSLRRAEPLVAVPGVDVCPEPFQIERQLSGCVRAVDDREDAGLARGGADLLDRKHQRRR